MFRAIHASAGSQWLLGQNDPCAKEAYFGVAILVPSMPCFFYSSYAIEANPFLLPGFIKLNQKADGYLKF